MMSDQPPPDVPEPDELRSDEPEEDDPLDDPLYTQPQQPGSWRRWLIVGLVITVVLAVGAASVIFYFARRSWQSYMQSQFGLAQLAPATPPGAGPFDKVTDFAADEYVQALSGGDVDGDGEAEGIVWIGENISLRDAEGNEEASFPSGLAAFDAPASLPGGYAVPTPVQGGGVRTPLVGTLQGKPAIVVTDGEGPSVFAYRADGEQVLEDNVQYTHVQCLTLADLDADGEDEILVGRTSQLGLLCLDSARNEKWRYGAATVPKWVTVGDANGDGVPEIIVGYDTSAAHIVSVDGKQVGAWSTWRLEGAVEAADLDGDGSVEFLVSLPPQPMASGGGPSLQQGLTVEGLNPDGGTAWSASLPSGPYWMGTSHLASADLDADGVSEWIASAPDGTVRVYDKDGNELGRYALGKDIQTLGVVGPDDKREKPRLWVSLGNEVVVLEWR